MIPLRDENPTHHFAWVTLILIAVNVFVFVFVQERDTTRGEIEFTYEFAAIPCEIVENRPLDIAEVRATLSGDDEACQDTDSPSLFPDKQVWLAGFTSMFLHGDWFHLGFNMLFLWIFGNNIEDHVGPIKYLLFYVAAGIAALVAHIALQVDSTIPVVGASGAIAGVMGAYAVWFPRAPVRTAIFIFFIRDIAAAWLLGIWFVTQFFTGQDSGVAWAAHVGGFVFGAVLAGIVRVLPPLRRLVWRPPHDRRGPWDPTGGIGQGPYQRPRYADGTLPRANGRPW